VTGANVFGPLRPSPGRVFKPIDLCAHQTGNI
jgi:hypothetical protein